MDPNSQSYYADKLFKSTFEPYNVDFQFLLIHPTWTISTPEYNASYQEFKSNLTSMYPIDSFISYFDYPEYVTAYSADKKKVEVTARVTNGVTDTITYSEIQAATTGNPLTIEIAGYQLTSNAIVTQLQQDLVSIEEGGVPVLIAVLILVFGGILAILPGVCLVFWTLAGSLSVLYGIGKTFEVTTFATVRSLFITFD